MILWVRKIGLIFGLAIFIFACEESGELGLEIDPERGNFKAKYTEIPLRTSVIQTDSVSTKNMQQVLVSRLEDPEFGKIYTEAYSQLFLAASELSIPGVDSAFYDSLVMDMNIIYQYGPQDGSLQTINFHELSDTIPWTSRFTFNTTPYFSESLGQVDFDISSFETTSLDTVLSFRLSDELGERFFNRAQVEGDINDDNDEFKEFFNGMAFVPGELNSLSVGLSLYSAKTGITMHYHTLSDTVEYTFRFFDGRFNPVIANYYHHMQLDKSGTALEGLSEPYKEFFPTNGKHYTHAGFGILSRVSLTPLNNFIDTVGTVIVNRAEIEIVTEGYDGLFATPGSVKYYILDEDNRFILTNLGPKAIYTGTSKTNFLEAPFIQYDNSTSGFYSGETSWFVGELIKGTNADSVFAVFPADYGAKLSRIVGKGDQVKLKLTYSSL